MFPFNVTEHNKKHKILYNISLLNKHDIYVIYIYIHYVNKTIQRMAIK